MPEANIHLPCVAWQLIQTPFQRPVSENTPSAGGRMKAAGRGIQRESPIRNIAGSWQSTRLCQVRYQYACCWCDTVVRTIWRVGIVQRRPEFGTSSFQLNRIPWHIGDEHVIEIRDDRLGCRHLCHRPVVRRPPAGVFGWMTGAAGVGRNVAVVGDLDRTSGNGHFFWVRLLGSNHEQACRRPNQDEDGKRNRPHTKY